MKIYTSRNFNETNFSQNVFIIKKSQNNFIICNTKEEQLMVIKEDKKKKFYFDWYPIVYNGIEKNYVTITFDDVTDKEDNSYTEKTPTTRLVGVFNLDNAINIPSIFQEVSLKYQKLPNKAKKGNKYGYIDLTGKTVIPFRYDEVSDFYADTERASVYSKEGYFWINKKGIILSDVKDTTSSVVSRREDDITKKNINTIKTPVSDYQVHQSNGVLQVKYKDILIGSLVAQNCYFDEKNGVFNVTMNDGKRFYLNPLLKPLFLFEYDYADFWQ